MISMLLLGAPSLFSLCLLSLAFSVCSFYLPIMSDASKSVTISCPVGIVLFDKGNSAILDRIPVDSRSCAVGLQGSVGVFSNAPMNSSTDAQKDEFYDALAVLVFRSKGCGIVMVAGDFNEIGKPDPSEACLDGFCGLPTQRTDNGDRQLQFSVGSRLFLSITNIRHGSRRTATWSSKFTFNLSQVGLIAISYRWSSSVRGASY